MVHFSHADNIIVSKVFFSFCLGFLYAQGIIPEDSQFYQRFNAKVEERMNSNGPVVKVSLPSNISSAATGLDVSCPKKQDGEKLSGCFVEVNGKVFNLPDIEGSGLHSEWAMYTGDTIYLDVRGSSSNVEGFGDPDYELLYSVGMAKNTVQLPPKLVLGCNSRCVSIFSSWYVPDGWSDRFLSFNEDRSEIYLDFLSETGLKKFLVAQIDPKSGWHFGTDCNFGDPCDPQTVHDITVLDPHNFVVRIEKPIFFDDPKRSSEQHVETRYGVIPF